MSEIQWTDVTANPIKVKAGGGNYCEKISPGCQFCYAEMKNRNSFFGGNGQPYTVRKDGPPEMTLNVEMIEKWARMRVPKKHFVGSMTDIFGDWVSDDILSELFGAMLDAPTQTFQILTKRIERVPGFLVNWLRWNGLGQLPANIWLGTSAEDQARLDGRLLWLIRSLAQTRFLSLEPLLGPISLPYQIGMVDWIIIGGESGHNARPMELEWVRDILAQCRAANIPAFVKQLGQDWAKETGAAHKKGGEPGQWPTDLRVRMMPGEEWGSE